MATSSGVVLLFPPGAFDAPVTVQVGDVDASALPASTTSLLAEAAIQLAYAFRLDTGGVEAKLPVSLSAPNVARFPDGRALVLHIPQDFDPILFPEVLVDAADVTASSFTTSPATSSFPGVRFEGIYVVAFPDPAGGSAQPTFVTATGLVPPAFVQGFVESPAGPVAGALVQSIQSPIPSRSDADGSYVVHLGASVEELPTITTIVADHTTLLAGNPISQEVGSIIPSVRGGAPGGPMWSVKPTMIYPIPSPYAKTAEDLRRIWRTESAQSAIRSLLNQAVCQNEDQIRSILATKLQEPIKPFGEALTLEVNERKTFFGYPMVVVPELPLAQPLSTTAFSPFTMKIAELQLVVKATAVVVDSIVEGGIASVEAMIRKQGNDPSNTIVLELLGKKPGSGELKGQIVDFEITATAEVCSDPPVPSRRSKCPNGGFVSVSAKLGISFTNSVPFTASVLVGAFWHEGFEISPPGTYVPSLETFPGEEGTWMVEDTINDDPAFCGVASPHRARILPWGEDNQALRLDSFNSGSECADNVWVQIFPVNVPLDPTTVLSFREVGALVNPEAYGGIFPCFFPPCGDNINLRLIDNRGNVVAYVLQSAPDHETVSVPFYEEVILQNSNADDIWRRSVYPDFLEIDEFDPFGASIFWLVFEIEDHGWAMIDDIAFHVGI